MTNQERFDRSVAVLAKAYLDGYLQSMSCAACACGNLIAAANGFTIVPSENFRTISCQYKWQELNKPLFNEQGLDVHNVWNNNSLGELGRRLVANTGYAPKQLAMIERAFMNETGLNATDEDNFRGLMAVVDTLAVIHYIDLTVASKAKGQFVKELV